MELPQLIYMAALAVFGALLWPFVGYGEKVAIRRMMRRLEKQKERRERL